MVKLVIDEKSFERGASDKITGNIYFEINGQYFPEKNWNDYISIILAWWVNIFLDSLDKDDSEFEFCFMDGPFVVLVKIIDNRMYELQFEGTEIISHISQKHLKEMLLNACEKFLKSARKRYTNFDNLMGIEKMTEKLKMI